MIRIKFPSPDELSAEDWFEQMELSLYHAKKAYDKFASGIDEEKREDIGIHLSFPGMEKNKTYEALMETEKISFADSQEVELVISY